MPRTKKTGQGQGRGGGSKATPSTGRPAVTHTHVSKPGKVIKKKK